MDVIVLSEIKWSYMRTRKHYLLSRFPKDWRIFFFEPFAKGRKSSLFPGRDGNVTFVTVPVLKSGTRLRLYNAAVERKVVRGAVSFLTLACVRFWMAVLRVRRPAFCLVSNVLFLPVAKSLKPLPVFYDCNDDPVHFPSSRKWVAGCFRELIAISDMVFVCSKGLMVLAKSMGAKNPVMVGNGVDLELFAGRVGPDDIPGDIGSKKKPILGYVGTFSEWFDTHLLEELSRNFPQCSLIIVGPVALGMREQRKRLEESTRNVYFLGERKAGELSRYLGPMDVCLIPFTKNEFTRSLNPNKVYEYMASGKTTVSLNYSEDLELLKDFIYLAEDEDEFIELVKLALSSPRDPELLRKKAEENSWDRKAAQMLGAIDEFFGRKGAGRSQVSA
ncbi:MAG: glycosyltransferase [Candidatus Eisenbacteria bacterium]|nr:glycosyltransferase [Candidatus Eisenbacteria bacterium]